MAEKKWQLPHGSRTPAGQSSVAGLVMAGDIAQQRKKDMDRDNEINEMKHEETKLEHEKKIAVLHGEDEKEKELKQERKAAQDLREKLAQEQREREKDNLSYEIDKLRQLMETSTSKTSLADQVTAVLTVAEKLGFARPTAPVSLGDQIKQAKDIATELGLADKKEGAAKGISDDVALKLQEMSQSFQLQIRKMDDERDQNNKRWDMAMKKYDDDINLRRQEIVVKANSEKERTQMIKDGVETIGKVVGKSLAGGGLAGAAAGVATGAAMGAADSPPMQFTIEAGMDEAGELNCPRCGSNIFLAPDATQAICGKCGAIGMIKRVSHKGGEVNAGKEVESEAEAESDDVETETRRH